MDHARNGRLLHIAQFNLAVLRHPVDHPESKGFVDLIDDTNAHAEASPGFVWRFGISTVVDDLPYDDKHITVNASVWESPQHLRDFAYRGFHRDVFRQRADWFVDSAAVMWWVDAGTTPTPEECLVRMDFYGEFGSTPYSFTTGERVPVMFLDHRPNGIVAEVDGIETGCAAWRAEEDGWHVTELRADHGGEPHLAAVLATAARARALDADVATITLERGAASSEHDDDLRRVGFQPAADGGWRLAIEPVRSWKRPPRDSAQRHPGAAQKE